ncbi:TNT domain-containing protein [Chryseobacterium sp. WG23]|uniref:TNT domain-containing protein n=1 Tax=Chryseobacterium sp. WG23 TaxID=2926910 RepID=UPI00211DD9F0|nr:TNT domain-containing protein [Chryseobacterium sp. WG23]MCQ9633339.1 TNT domain-containing protein [Chryseobacterium sp. WG23]
MKHLLKYIFLLSFTFFSVACSSDNDEVIDTNPVKIVFYKNADDFALTYDAPGAVNQTIRNQAFDLYKQGKWNELEALFKANSLNGGWPPANGGYNIVDDVPIVAGQKFDRYSGAVGNYDGTGVPTLGGSFTSPIINGYVYTFTQRALNQPENKYDFYYEIDVLNNLLSFKSQTADIIPWFNQAGNGKQTMWKIPIDIATGYPKTWNKLAEEGYIKVTIKKSPSGKYNNLAGTVIQ